MWHELKSQNDIDAFMKSVASFHDACITGLSYTSGTYVNDDNAMVMVTEPYIYITFHSQMANFPKFEMELGLVDKFSINLHLDNSLEIYEATFKKKVNKHKIGSLKTHNTFSGCLVYIKSINQKPIPHHALPRESCFQARNALPATLLPTDFQFPTESPV